MNKQQRIDAFSKLGSWLSQTIEQYQSTDESQWDENLLVFDQKLNLAKVHNAWFVKDNMLFALSHWAKLLNSESLSIWLKNYEPSAVPKAIGVVQAGNLPLVGFHDFLAVLMSGHQFVGKASSKDSVWPKFLAEQLIKIEPLFTPLIVWSEQLKKIDAVIATGSDNSSRYFEYYFKSIPHIIRKNRSSWAVLTGTESTEELQLLGDDIFRYFGLGCRNVSKIFVPKAYSFNAFFEAIEPFADIRHHHKYANNYDYNRSVYMLNQEQYLDNGFLMVKEDLASHSPLSVVFFEYYQDIESVWSRVRFEADQIQCICEQGLHTEFSVKLGQSQKPSLSDYADHVNLMEWLIKI